MYQGTWTRHDGISVIAALKTLDTVSTTEDEGNVLERARTDMLREARTMRELSGHPNLIRAFGVTIDRELPYAVMEFINGKLYSFLLRLIWNDRRRIACAILLTASAMLLS